MPLISEIQQISTNDTKKDSREKEWRDIGEQETWTPIKEYEELYKISNFGTVISIKTGKIKKSCLWNGYYKVQLHKNKKIKTIDLHKLVAQHFLENPNNLKYIIFLDRNKLNCKSTNLKWTIRHETLGKKPKLNKNCLFYKLKENEVKKIFKLFYKKRWLIKNLSKKFKVSVKAINDIVSCKTWKYLKLESLIPPKIKNKIDCSKEIWKEIKDYPIYEVSNLGNVKRKDKKVSFRLENRDGWYKRAVLRKNGKSKWVYIHRLVAQAFILNPLNLPIINHINGDKSCNRADNLEWCSYRDNIIHAYSSKLRGNAQPELVHTNKLTKEQVYEIRNLIKEGKTYTFISDKFKISFKTISSIYYNKSWK